MKNLTKIITSFALIAVLINTFSLVAFATDETQAKGSIIIDYRKGDTVLDNIEFKVYQITSLDENGKQIRLPKYKDVEVDYELIYNDDYWLSFRDNLENYINYNMVEPEYTFKTDDTGLYHLENLELGVYFIQAETAVKDDRQIFSEPILMMVGHYDESEKIWNYHYRIKPKVEILDKETYNLSVQKIWENTNSELLIPDEIEVEIHKNGEFYDKVKLSKENDWSHTWTDVDPLAVWGIKELDEYEDFVVQYEKDILSFKITNTYTGEEEEELPQTGSSAYLIPIFASAGLVLVLLGVLLNKKNRYKEND